jgi:hypothetical protein
VRILLKILRVQHLITHVKRKGIQMVQQLEDFQASGRTSLFLLPKTTRELHPYNAGIIQSYKFHFRQRHLRWVLMILEQIEGGPVDFEKINPDVKQL